MKNGQRNSSKHQLKQRYLFQRGAVLPVQVASIQANTSFESSMVLFTLIKAELVRPHESSASPIREFRSSPPDLKLSLSREALSKRESADTHFTGCSQPH